MKKALLILLTLLIFIAPIFSVTQEEFDEVYNALAESTQIMKTQEERIEELENTVNELIITNKYLTSELKLSKFSLENADKLLESSQEQLEKTNKVLKGLNNRRVLFGLVFGLKDIDFKKPVNYGIGINVGYRFLVGYWTFNISTYSDKTMNFGVGYNFTF